MTTCYVRLEASKYMLSYSKHNYSKISTYIKLFSSNSTKTYHPRDPKLYWDCFSSSSRCFRVREMFRRVSKITVKMTPELFKRFKNMFSLKTILHTYQCIFHSSIQVISYEIVLNYELPSRDSSSSFSYFNGFIIMPCLYISKNSIKIVNPVSFKFTDQPSAYIYITPRILESYKIK